MANYDWAANPLKLAVAEQYLKNQQKINPSLVIDEEAIKAEYIRRAGLVLDGAQVAQVVEKKKRAKKS